MAEPTKHAVRRVVAAALGTIWAIEESVLASMVEILQLRHEGFAFTEEEVQSRITSRVGIRGLDEENDRGPRRIGSVAVLPLHGVMGPRLNMFQRVSGGTSTQEVAGWFRAAMADPDVKAIVLDIDSPGGDARGNEELATLIRESRGTKPITTVFTGTGASAAYYVGSAADEVVASPSTEVGSIGTFMIHAENSKAAEERGVTYTVVRSAENKGVGNSAEPLGEHGESVIQERIDGYHRQFVAAVAANRGVSIETVERNFGRGSVMLAPAAKDAGLLDRVATLEEVLADLNDEEEGPSPARTRGGPTGDSGAGSRELAPPATRLERTMNENVLKLMAACGLVSEATIGAEGGDATAEAALQAFYVARGRSVPAAAEQQEADLAKFKEELDGAGDRQLAEARAAAATAERNRIADLQARGELLGVTEADIQASIDAGDSVESALKHWTGKMAETQRGLERVEVTESRDEKFGLAASEALFDRTGYRPSDQQLSQGASELRHMTLLQLAEQSLRIRGERTAGMDADDLARAALKSGGEEILVRASAGGGAVRPGDFPNLLANTMGRMLEPIAQYSGATYRQWANRLDSVADFRPKTLIATGEFGEFPHVPDGENFEESSIGEEASWISTDAYGDEWKLTPMMIANDDLGALTDAATDKVNAHELTLNRLCINLLTGNVVLPDGQPLFDDTAHANDVTSGAAPSDSELAKMRLKLRKQQGVSAKRKLNLTLRSLLIPEDLETSVEKLLATLQVVPESTTNAQIFRGKVQWYVDPMLGEHSAVKYYGFADPRLARSIVYVHQRGFESMKVRNYWNPKNGCRHWQFEGRFGAAVRNWRGVVRNAGE